MIIRVTLSEVHRFIANAMNLPMDRFSVEIMGTASGSVRNALDILSALRTAVREFPRYDSGDKIAAIKRFRDLCPKAPNESGQMYSCVALVDAKWAIENVNEAISNLENTGRLK